MTDAELAATLEQMADYIGTPEDVGEALREAAARLRALSVPGRPAHRCYRPGCGAMTTLGTAWCQKCLDEAKEEQRRYPPRPKLPMPKPGTRWRCPTCGRPSNVTRA